MITLFDQYAKEYDFITVNAGRPVMDVFSDLQNHIRQFLEDQQPVIEEAF